MSIELQLIGTLLATAVGAFVVVPVEMWRHRTRRLVMAHVGADLSTGTDTLYIKVVNTGRTQPLQVTHVYLEFDLEGKSIRRYTHIEGYDRLGVLTAAMEQEFYRELNKLAVPHPEEAWKYVRVRFTDGCVEPAVSNEDVPAAGNPSPQSFQLTPLHIDGRDRLLALQ